jgi:hypothetical protein
MAASVVQGVLLQAPLLLPGAQASISQPSCCRAATDNAHFYGSMSVRLSLSPSSSVSSDVSCSGEDRVLLSIRTGSRCRSREIVCMAHPRRVKMVQQQIQRELADMLLHDKVLQAAVLPEAALGADMYLSSMATISDVEISKDLQVLSSHTFGVLVPLVTAESGIGTRFAIALSATFPSVGNQSITAYVCTWSSHISMAVLVQ